MKLPSLTFATLQETLFFGNSLGEQVSGGDVICLDGELGAGKTTLTQAIAAGLKVPQKYYVTSPSFNVFHEYPGRIPLYHMDFYRLGDSDDVLTMGLDEYFYGNGVVVIEWAEKAEDLLPPDCLRLFLSAINKDQRKVDIHFFHERWKKTIEAATERLTE